MHTKDITATYSQPFGWFQKGCPVHALSAPYNYHINCHQYQQTHCGSCLSGKTLTVCAKKQSRIVHVCNLAMLIALCRSG